ncbi:MAG: hypothetical protein Hyperionvirus24_21 [Hyperionvirus sp.]|uniref:Uncharacterized protein n=1 Tax=Hyperionvirus sp. TaxID=2487770 RepID=A0A3G5AG83_9VIRU|nr:MAG: hypothetical protein Hyperionvirus24_21 [Hyperionvirus sp.]
MAAAKAAWAFVPKAFIEFAICEQVEPCWIHETPKRFLRAGDKCECDFKYRLCRVQAEFPDEKISRETAFEITVEADSEVQGKEYGDTPDSFPVKEGASKFTMALSKEISRDDEATIIEPYVATLKYLFGVGTLIDSLRGKINRDKRLKKSIDRKEYALDIDSIESRFSVKAAGIRICSDKRHEGTADILEAKLIHLLLQSEIEPLFTQDLKKDNPHMGTKKKAR